MKEYKKKKIACKVIHQASHGDPSPSNKSDVGIMSQCKSKHMRVQPSAASRRLSGCRTHLDDVLVFLGDKQAGGVGGPQQVDEQVVGQHIQLLHVLPLHVGVASHAIAGKRKQTCY